MRFTLTRLVLFVVAIACLASVALAWDKDDYEVCAAFFAWDRLSAWMKLHAR